MLLNCDVGEDLRDPWDSKEIQPVHPKGNQSWIFIGRTDTVAGTPILWPPYVKNWLIWRDPDAGKDWRREEKGTTEDEMVGWMASPTNGHEFEQTQGDGKGQGSLACCSPWGRKESDTIEWLNWTEHGSTHQNKTQFPLSLSHQEVSISLLSLSIRGQTKWKP